MKKGFTLIELLAVIVILAVIVLIAVPLILSLVDKSRKKAAEESALFYVDTIENMLMINNIENTDGKTYKVKGKTVVDENNEVILNLEIKGDIPYNGVNNEIKINDGFIETANLRFNAYYVHYEMNMETKEFKTCTSQKGFLDKCDGTGSIKPNEEETPLIVAQTEPETPVDSYVRKQIDKVTFPTTQGFDYYIKSTKEGEVNGVILEKCGNELSPTVCVETTETTIQADYWYKVSGNVDVRYTKNETEEGTLFALASNGEKQITASDYIFKVDATGPDIVLNETSQTQQKIVIPFTSIDILSGIGKVTCKYSLINGDYTELGTLNEEYTTCSLDGLKEDTTYYYQVCAEDRVKNEMVCKTGDSRTKTTYVYDVLKKGDYVHYSPSRYVYELPTSITGYSSSQTIDPHEINTWYVNQIRDDKTVELVALSVSSNEIRFGTESNPIVCDDYIKALKYISQGYAVINLSVDTYTIVNNDALWPISGKYWLSKCYSDTMGYAKVSYGYEKPYLDGRFEYPFRPIVVLNKNVKVSGGDGTKDSPYHITI